MWDGGEGAHPKRHNAACDAVVAGVRVGGGDLEWNWFVVRVVVFFGSVGRGRLCRDLVQCMKLY